MRKEIAVYTIITDADADIFAEKFAKKIKQKLPNVKLNIQSRQDKTILAIPKKS